MSGQGGFSGLYYLRAVSCTSALSCTAAGENNYEEDFAEHWNGTEWQLQTMSEAHGVNYLEGISCVQPEREVCTTVGGIAIFQPLVESETVPIPFAESKEGTSTGETTETVSGALNPNGAETKYSFEYGTTTAYGSKTAEASAGSGTARVEESKSISGLTANTTYHFRIVATNSHGTSRGLDRTFKTPYWRITSTPNPVNTLNSYLWGTSCTSASACTAVGQYESNGTNYKPVPLAERWNGSEWSIQETPYLGEPKEAVLYGVACSSATSCIAVGFNESSSGTYFSLSESWNGTEWKVKTTPEPTGTLNSLLDGVSCSSASACTAVGYYENSSGVEVPFAERWNGTEWTVQSMPAPTGAKATNLSGVSCPTATACTAGGEYTNSSGVRVPFAEAWNGTSWAVQSVPNPSGSRRAEIRGVSCTSSTACTMVGSYETTAIYRVPFAARWNGTEWTEQSVPSPSGTKYSSLDGVSCASSTSCAAVGVSFSNASKVVTLAEHWNGTEWVVQSTPNDEKEEGWLSGGVSCSSAASCAAVGNIGKTFAEIYG